MWLIAPLGHACLAIDGGLPSVAHAADTANADAPSTSTALTAADRDAIAWFDSLGYPDLAGKGFVRVATGQSIKYGDDPWKNTYQFAFLLDERDGCKRRFESAALVGGEIPA